MTETLVLRHDAAEAALPHQVEAPATWSLKLPDPVQFEVSVPKWCPLDEDALVSLHWWASLVAHLYVLLPEMEADRKVHYRLEKALRSSLAILRSIYGGSLSGAISNAGMQARQTHKIVRDGLGEIGLWTMAVQVAFGLLCVRMAAKGKDDQIAVEIAEVYEWIDSAFKDRIAADTAYIMLRTLCTGTDTGTPEEKLAQWKGALAQAAEGVPDGAAPAVEDALDESKSETTETATHDLMGSGLTPGVDLTGVDESAETVCALLNPAGMGVPVEVIADGPPADPESPSYYQKCPFCATVVSGLSELSLCPVCLERRVGAVVPHMQPITKEQFEEACAYFEATAVPTIDKVLIQAEALRPAVRAALDRVELPVAQTPEQMLMSTAKLGMGLEYRSEQEFLSYARALKATAWEVMEESPADLRGALREALKDNPEVVDVEIRPEEVALHLASGKSLIIGRSQEAPDE